MESSKKLAKQILDLVGGSDNIVSVTHCATRLRPKFKNMSTVDVDALSNLKGVTGIVNNDSGFQIIIGVSVDKVYDEFVELMKESSPSQSREDNAESQSGGKKNWLNEFVAMVVAIFSPLLPVLAGTGLIKGLTILATEIGFLAETSTTHEFLYTMTNSVFYFFPILVAVTAAKRFKASPYIAAVVMGVFLLPDFMGYVEGDGGNFVTFFGIGAPVFNYTSQVLPAIIATWIQSKFEHVMEDKIPASLHLVLIPTVLIFVMSLITLYIVGPVGNYISIGVAQVVNWLANINPIITGAVIGGIWNILIMFGVHWAPNTMVIIPEIAKKGFSPFIAYGANANFGMAGAALTVFLKSKNKDLKNFSLSAIASVMLSGIVEPCIYGLGVKYKTPLIAGCLGAAMGGAFMGAFGVTGNAFVFGGLTTIPAFAGATLWAYVLGIAISFVAGAILTFVIGVKDPEAKMSK